jgi:PAS domain S-box-containing protein
MLVMKHDIEKNLMKLLVIDDDEVVLNQTAQILSDEGYQVQTANHGKQGLAIARQDNPDLVITGVMMPEMDGYTISQQIKSDPQLADTIVILTSGVADRTEDHIKGYQSGADDYLSKKTDPQEFLYQIESLLRLKQVENKLRIKEQRFRGLFENIKDGVAIYQAVDAGKDFTIVDINPAGANIGQVHREEVIGKRVTNVFPGIDSMGLLEVFQRVWRSGEPETLKNKYYREDRHTFWVDNYVYRLPSGEVVALYHDTSEEKRAHTILRESEDRFRTLFTYVPIGLYRTTKDGIILDANPALVEMLGYPNRETMIEKSAFEIFVDADQRWDQIEILENQDELTAQEIRVYKFDGSIIWAKDTARAIYDIKGNLSYYLGSLEDITSQVQARKKLHEYSENLEVMVHKRTRELDQAQKQLLRQEKLAVLGQLAGGIGHDLRNPLGVISNSIYYLKMVMKDVNSEVMEYLKIVDEEVQTANSIVEDLLDFARTREPVKEPLTMYKFLEGLLSRYPAPDGIEVFVEIPKDFPQIWVDPKQIYTVFVNLITNAYQSMPDGGVLTLRGKVENINYICLQVIDTGEGISDENIDNIFEPLFTTKSRGVGLGLVTAKNLIEANRGRITVSSKLSSGTVFSAFLPVWKDYDKQ